MSKFFLHIKGYVKVFVFALSFLVVSDVFAQDEYATQDTLFADDEYTTVETEMVDEVATVQAPEAQTFYFDAIGEGGKIDYKARPLSDSIVSELKKDEAFWYANLPAKQKKAEKKEELHLPFYLQAWFRNLLWFIIIAGFVAILIWFLLSSNVLVFRRKPGEIKSEEEALEEDIFSIDYEKEVAKAANSGNYRLAIRLMYLQTLKLLSDRGIIQYKIERTNSDYLMQLFNTAYYKDFFRLTRDFEYTWYGKFEVGEKAYQSIQQDFVTFKRGVH